MRSLVWKHTRRRTRTAGVLLWALALAAAICSVQSLPRGFVSEIVHNSRTTTTRAIRGAFAPNLRRADRRPMMLIISREGTVRVLENPDNRNDGGDYKEDYENNLILDLSSKICDNGERGLLSVAIHPNFEEKRWVYLHYTRWREGCLEDAMLGPQNVLVRYTLNPNTLILENEELLVQGGMLSKTVHNGGAMVFGTDGHLYLATGDGGGDRASAQDKTNLHGKLLRLRDDGSVPENNPYALTGIPCGQSKRVLPPIGGSEGIYCSEIVSWGFSDPTRMVLRPRDSDEMVSIRDARAETVQIFVPKRVWPGDYKRLVADFGLDKIDNLIKDPECLESSCVPPRFTNTTFYESIQTEHGDTLHEASRMVDLFFGPYRDTQALYVIQNHGTADSILRIRYLGLPPVAVIAFGTNQHREPKDTTATTTTTTTVDGSSSQTQTPFLVGDAVRFDGSGSFDPDGGALSFQWDFGDGYDSTTNTTTPGHAYETPGEYTVILVVTNSKNRAHLASATVVVGNAPTAIMLSPMEGDVFTLGEPLRLDGEAWDFDGNRIPEDRMKWQVRHYYHSGGGSSEFFLEETSGNDFDTSPIVVVPKAKDGSSSSSSSAEIGFLRVTLLITDQHGFTTTIATDVEPNRVAVNVVTEPEGLVVYVDDSELVTPTQIQSWTNSNLPVHIPPEQPPYRFQHWSDGNTEIRRAIPIPPPSPQESSTRITRSNATTVTIEAIFCLIDDASCGGASTSCCIGYCNERGFCGNETRASMELEDTSSTESPSMGETVSLPTRSNESDVAVSPTEEELESFIFNDTESMEDSDATMNLANEDANLRNRPEKTDDENQSDEFWPPGKWLIGASISVLLIAPFFFAWKYFELKRKIEKQPKNRLSKNSQDRTTAPKSVAAASRETEHISKGIVDSDETNVSISSTNFHSRTSNTSFGSSSASFNKSAAIWEKIANETERRTKLRAKYSSPATAANATTPPTPETAETEGSPSTSDSTPSPSSALSSLSTNIDETLMRLDDLLSKCKETDRRTKSRARYSSRTAAAGPKPKTPERAQTTESPSNIDAASAPSNDLSTTIDDTNIDQTFERLDDLLSKCFTRKLTRSSRKRERNHAPPDGGSCPYSAENVESGISNMDSRERHETGALAPIWLSSTQESMPGSPLREKSDDSFVEGTFPMSSLYSSGSFQDDRNESRVLNLPEVSTDSHQSLLIFQDNELSMSHKGVSMHASDTNDDVLESGMICHRDRPAGSDLLGSDDRRSLADDENDLDQYFGGYW